MSRKTFTNGQLVKVQREVDSPWETATYDKPTIGGPGHHIVNFLPVAPPRIINMPVGDRRDVEVRWVSVPARRIRAATGSVLVALDADLVAAIDAYLDTDWKDGRDPSKLGALNAVAFIGERVAAIRKAGR